MTITVDDALAVHALGLAVYPPKQDGTKRPLGNWREYENVPPSAEVTRHWYLNGRDGIGLICGASSGNLEMFELEGAAVREGMLDALYERAEQWGVSELLYRVSNAYMESTPSGGVHFLFRVDGPALGNVKLTRREAGVNEAGAMEIETLIETRGQGGFTIIAPSGGKVHETGASYELLCGSLAEIVTITEAERDKLHELGASFDMMPKRRPTTSTPPPPSAGLRFETIATGGGGWFDAVVDDYNARTTWNSVLTGWTHSHTHGEEDYWVRPGKDARLGHSATTNAKGTDRLIIFSSSVPGDFETYDGTGLATSYDRFSTTAILDYHGDRTEAAKALRQAGYGPPAQVDDVTPFATITPSSVTNDPDWPILHADAMHGPIGDYVRAAAPHTEADPVAILAQLLAGVGCIANRGPHMEAGNDRHPAALFVAIVGATAKGKKGTSWSAARIVLERMDPDFTHTRILGGFGSGEVLIETLAAPDDDDEGFAELRDTRVLVQEGELASILSVAGRDSSTLGQTIRNAWDGKTLAARTRGKGSHVVTDYHASIVGHITMQELRATMSTKDIFGGTTNRFLWVAAKRARLLPHGGNIPEDIAAAAANTLIANVTSARKHGTYKRTPAASDRWVALYHLMAEDEPDGLLGAAIARAEAQVTRLSLVYAIADGAAEIDVVHVEAAWAFWLYCRATAALIFPPSSTLAETLLAAIGAAKETGLTRTDLHRSCGNHAAATTINHAIDALVEADLVVEMKGPSTSKGGRRPLMVVLARYKAGDGE